MYGTESHHLEVRIRAVIELALNLEFYVQGIDLILSQLFGLASTVFFYTIVSNLVSSSLITSMAYGTSKGLVFMVNRLI